MIEKFKKIVLLLLLLPFLIVPAFAKTVSDVPSYSNNENDQDYYRYSNPVYSYLVSKKSGYERIQYLHDGKLTVTTLDSNFKPVSEEKIDLELPEFGGFYNGKDAYYLAVGQKNEEENDDKEVVRVIKYDKNWKRQGQASLNGANTIHPFVFGSLRMAEYNDHLYIRTCHEMYTSSDGLNHQANLSLGIYTPTMDLDDYSYGVSNIAFGYVSHSFNQFIIIDGNELVCLDHGDAYPRSAVLSKSDIPAGEPGSIGYGDYYSVDLMTYPGEIGENTTGASLGGLEYSNNNYLTVGNSTNTRDINNDTRDVYVTVTPKYGLDNEMDSSTNTIWLTSLDSSKTTLTPQLVKYDNNTFAVLWTETNASGRRNSQKTYCQFIDGEGNLVGKATELDASLSDCQPIIVNGKAVWYVDKNDSAGNEELAFYTLDKSGQLDTTEIYKPIPAKDLTVEPTEVTFDLKDNQMTKQLNVTVEPEDTTDELAFKSSNTSVAEVNDSGLITAKSEGTATITVTVGTLSKEVKVDVIDHVEIYRLYNSTSGEHLYTPAAEEVKALENSGWTNEGIGWNAPRKGRPIYRLYNPVLADHLYTSDENEVNELTSSRGWVADFNREPIFYSTESGTPIYRLYNDESKRHLLTRDDNEYRQLPSHGWTQEGVSLYGMN